jgi:hypothetical protein
MKPDFTKLNADGLPPESFFPFSFDFGFADRGEVPLVLLARNGTGGSAGDAHADWVCVL